MSVVNRVLIQNEIMEITNNYSSSSASWAIDSEAMRVRGITVLVKSN